MVRMTEGQFALFTGKRKAAGGQPRKPAVRKRREELPENIVTKQIKDFLEARGWNVVRMNSGLFERRYGKKANQPAEGEHKPMVRIGTKGQADWLAYKRAEGQRFYLFHLEIKAPGKKPNPDQLLWMKRHQATGTPAEWFDGFDTGRRPFVRWFRENYAADLPFTFAEQVVDTEDF